MSDQIDKMRIKELIDEDFIEMDEEEADFLLKQDYATTLGQFFKFKPRLTNSSVEVLMSMNKEYYTKQILARSKAILEFASKHKNDFKNEEK
mmetsp:Transcript_1626/g.5632  ORF Transcript_1626/g.5632 Transcript_1626/m.5632 type:complete len:92 (+) Transcript_1626:2790-3065(+)